MRKSSTQLYRDAVPVPDFPNPTRDEESMASDPDLLSVVYAELRQVAAARLARELPGCTLQPTALVHEAYLRLTTAGKSTQWESQEHFFGAACIAMRRILVERARSKRTTRRGGNFSRVSFEANEPVFEPDMDLVVTLDELLNGFSKKHPRKAKLVELRFFAGLTMVEAAEMLEISVSMADQDWRFARAWLRVALSESSQSESSQSESSQSEM
ncbi:ECF-type sigma factor [bacterium]|nr:ECF-type sigma factor [bacterium]